jgi:pyruvate dehydrogenase E2 component (dihydrolipoamide acetyltransferase)
MSEIVMPRLSDSMEEGTILKWLKADGDAVSRGEPLAEIETDKATLTYESDAAGTLTIVVQAGETLPIGEVIARLDDGSASSGDAEPAEAEAEPSAAAEPPEAEPSAAAEPAEAEPSAAPEPAEAEPSAAPEPAEPSAPAPAPAPATAEGEASTAPPKPAPSRKTGRVKASPLARRMAREQGIDLHLVGGTGPGGRVVRADVEEAAQAGTAQAGERPEAEAESTPLPAEPGEPKPSPAEAPAAEAPAPPPKPTETGTAKGDITVQELTRIQQVIARRMAESKATVPEFTLRGEIDMEGCVKLRSELKALGGEVPSYNDMVVKACALALREFPRANGSYKDGKFELHSRVNVGVAVAATDALVVPTIFDADAKSLREIARQSRALAEKVRAGTVAPPELSGGTFTVSNLGMFGVTDFTAVINPPQAAILAVGALAPRAVVRDGELVARHTMGVTLACDHRILYGADAARFLARIRELLEAPLALAF